MIASFPIRLLCAFLLLAAAMLTGMAQAEPLAKPEGSVVASAADDGWRRTTRGWEHRSAWQRPLPVTAPSLATAWLQRRSAGVLLIVAGAVGVVLLLMVEIDPPERHAFRIWRQRG